jgi:PilZ domain
VNRDTIPDNSKPNRAQTPKVLRPNRRREELDPKIHMTQGQSGPELRRWTRHRIDARLKVIFQGEKGPASVFGRANILGQGGMGAFIPASLPLGATVSLEVSFPYSPAEVRLQAVVRNSEGFRYGLEFVDVRDDIRDIIVKNCGAAAILQ